MKREQIVARLAEIQNALGEIQAAETGFTEEQLTQIEEFNNEFADLSKQLEALDKVEAMTAKANASAGRKTAPITPAASVRVQVGASATDKFGGFKSSGEFLNAVKRAASGDIAPEFKNVMYEKNGEDGGFLVPEDISLAIQKKLDAPESLMSHTNVTQISGNSLTLTLDESQPWNQGIQAYWTAEGAAIQESKPKFTQGSWRLHKLAAMVKPTDELLDDSVALESYIKNAAPDAIMYKINAAIINGDGVGKPMGFMNSPFTVTVPAEGGQTADTIVAKNIIKMYTRMMPSARAGAAWHMNAGAEEQLLGMTDANGNYIYLSPGSQLNQSPYGLLMGRPVYPMLSGLPGLGDSGDIVFANLKWYYMIRKAGGIKAATSIHLHFDREITAFRFSMRVDGRAPWQQPVTTENGNYQVSAFVKLADR